MSLLHWRDRGSRNRKEISRAKARNLDESCGLVTCYSKHVGSDCNNTTCGVVDCTELSIPAVALRGICSVRVGLVDEGRVAHGVALSNRGTRRHTSLTKLGTAIHAAQKSSDPGLACVTWVSRGRSTIIQGAIF